MKLHRFTLLLVATLPWLGGCDDAETTKTPERGGTAKSDLVGMCSPDDCGGPASSGNCWCDDECDAFGDCCANRDQACGPSGSGCEGHDTAACEADPSCEPTCVNLCDCACPGNDGTQCGGCAECGADCFEPSGCTDAQPEPTPVECGSLSTVACEAEAACQPTCVSVCGCDCPDNDGLCGGCAECSADCFIPTGCTDAQSDPDPVECSNLSAMACETEPACEPTCVNLCDCACPGGDGTECGCAECEPGCFEVSGCADAA